MTGIDFSEIETINVDLVIGFGETCRVASALKRNNLRFFSSPFDWMMKYSLDSVISVISNFLNDGSVFFNKCYDDEKYSTNDYIGVIDKDNGMVSMHDFPKYLPIEDAPCFFYKKYKNRFSNLNKFLKKAKKICFLTNRQITLDEMKLFISQIKQFYKFEHIYFINVYDTLSSDIESFEKYEDNNVTYLIYKFNDEHKNGRDKLNNPDFWLGDIDFWNEILGKIKLNKKLIYIYKIRRFIISVRNKFLSVKPCYKVKIL